MNPVKPSHSNAAAFVLGSAVLLLSGCGPAPEPAAAPPTEQAIQDATQMAPTVRPAISVNALMVSSIDHAAHEIWDAGAEPPKTDEAWLEVDYHAIQLAAMGTMISLSLAGPADPGWARLPDWQRYAQQMSDAGVAARTAAEAKDAAAIMKAGDALVATCEGCHKQFKPESPTEGLVHTPHYPR
jgi:hypothetical protein